MLRAHTWALLGNKSDSMRKEALECWAQLAKDKAHQHVAWASQALLESSGSPTPNAARKLLEQTRLADDLSSGTEWYYKIALAFAQAANQDLPQAAKTARHAAELAIGDKRQLCTISPTNSKPARPSHGSGSAANI